MSEMTFYHWLVIAWMAVAVCTFFVLFFVTAPYGRFTRKGWGPEVNSRLGWILMETPVLIAFLVLYGISDRKANPVSIVVLLFWCAHYVHRSLIYPFRLRTSRPTMTVSVIALGATFNIGNGYLNGRALFALSPELTASWFHDPRFIVGALLFWGGFIMNQHSDLVLMRLRADGKKGYKIPYGGAYRYVSCPNYTGEMIEWGGWALLCWNLGALAFLVWTVANLAPRAWKTHRWYRQEFPDYPHERKALLPFLV